LKLWNLCGKVGFRSGFSWWERGCIAGVRIYPIALCKAICQVFGGADSFGYTLNVSQVGDEKADHNI
jgi:hypothetical protein